MKTLDIKYNTFWRRFSANLIDTIIFAPLWILEYFLFESDSGSVHLITITTLNLVIPNAYSIWMTGRFGATVGKMAMKIKVFDGDTEHLLLSYKRAFYRDSVLMIFEVIGLLYMVIAWLNGDDFLSNRSPVIVITNFLSGVWVLAEIITMLGNDRRRAIHDILANSVVIKTEVIQ